MIRPPLSETNRKRDGWSAIAGVRKAKQVDSIISNTGGPNMNREFNLYYLHWWTLTHFIFESPKYQQSAMVLLQRGGGLDAFEQTIGPVAAIEPEWYRHVQTIKAALNGKVRNFYKTGQLPPDH